jgi:hypothetical protein
MDAKKLNSGVIILLVVLIAYSVLLFTVMIITSCINLDTSQLGDFYSLFTLFRFSIETIIVSNFVVKSIIRGLSPGPPKAIMTSTHTKASPVRHPSRYLTCPPTPQTHTADHPAYLRTEGAPIRARVTGAFFTFFLFQRDLHRDPMTLSAS